MTTLRLQDEVEGNVLDEVRKLRSRVTGIEENMVSVNGLRNRSLGFSVGDIGWLAMSLPLFSFRNLRALWPMSSRFAFDAYDLSGQGRTLTSNGNVGNGTHNDLITVATFNGSSQYFSRSDETALDLSDVFIGGWWKFDNATIGTDEVLISKWGTVGNQRSYELRRNATGETIDLIISTTGSDTNTLTGPVVQDTFPHLIWARHNASTEWAVGVDHRIISSNVSVPAGAFSGSAALAVGARTGGSLFFDGWASCLFFCSYPVDDDRPLSYYALSSLIFGG